MAGTCGAGIPFDSPSFKCSFSGVNLLYEKHLEEENGIGGVFWP